LAVYKDTTSTRPVFLPAWPPKAAKRQEKTEGGCETFGVDGQRESPPGKRVASWFYSRDITGAQLLGDFGIMSGMEENPYCSPREPVQPSTAPPSHGIWLRRIRRWSYSQPLPLFYLVVLAVTALLATLLPVVQRWRGTQ
jgi:hypothetical protein